MPTKKSIKARISEIVRSRKPVDVPGMPPARPEDQNDERLQARYNNELALFEALGGRVTHRFKILNDYEAQAGTASGHYFHQDLLVASFVYENSPSRHIDVGSRIDGFVAHVASFRKIEVMDVRDLQNTGHANISFIKSNLMEDSSAHDAIADSISCLHALEHFGLGRYGDPLDPLGHIKGFRNIIRMLRPGGMFYVSFPIGLADEVHFNAHRVFSPLSIFDWIRPSDRLSLIRFDFVDDLGALHSNFDLNAGCPNVSYGCGIYSFRRI